MAPGWGQSPALIRKSFFLYGLRPMAIIMQTENKECNIQGKYSQIWTLPVLFHPCGNEPVKSGLAEAADVQGRYPSTVIPTVA